MFEKRIHSDQHSVPKQGSTGAAPAVEAPTESNVPEVVVSEDANEQTATFQCIRIRRQEEY